MKTTRLLVAMLLGLATTAMAVDPAWLEIPLAHVTEDAVSRTVTLMASSQAVSSGGALDAGAWCERTTSGLSFSSRPSGTILIFR